MSEKCGTCGCKYGHEEDLKLEVEALNGVVAVRTRERDEARAEVERLRAIVTSFNETARAAIRHFDNRGKGGQQVSYCGDFCNMHPSLYSALRCWVRDFEQVLSGGKWPPLSQEELDEVGR